MADLLASTSSPVASFTDIPLGDDLLLVDLETGADENGLIGTYPDIMIGCWGDAAQA